LRAALSAKFSEIKGKYMDLDLRLPEYYGQQFDKQRTRDTHGDLGMLKGNYVNFNVPSGSTHFDHLMEIGRLSNRPFPIKFLSKQLKGYPSVRGRTFFGRTVDQIREILCNYSQLRWWMERDGLVVDEVKSELGPLASFDRIAGQLVIEHWKDDGLPQSNLQLIASRLDGEGFQLKEYLQPAQWKPISEYNQKHSRSPVRTFGDAVQRPQFVRSVRRRLYVARDRYKKALRPVQPVF
jgi:hypothetical protein